MTTCLAPFAPDLWTAEGPTVTAAAGFHYPTRMAVIRLRDGGLFVWSPVALSPDLRRSVDGLGPVRFVVAPNALHDSFLAEWQASYPGAKFYAPPGLSRLRTDLAFAGELDDGAPKPWAGEIEQLVVRGNAITTEVVFFHRPSGVAIFTDLIQQFHRGWFRGWRGLVARLDLMTGDEPAVPRKFRLAFTDRPAARAAMRDILAWPTRQVLMAHGAPVERDGQAFLRRAFRWLGV